MLFSTSARRLLAAAAICALSACSGGSCASCNAPPIFTPSPGPGVPTPTPLPGATATPTPGGLPTATPTPTPSPVPTATPIVALSCAQNAISGGAVPLGTDATVALLAGSTITNTGVTTITGDVDVSPGAAVTGFGPGAGTVIGGSINAGNPAAAQAQLDLTTAYNNAAGRPNPLAVPGDIGGMVIAPGVYRAPVSLAITGNVTLDGQNNPNSVFIFQAPTTLTTATNSSVTLINRANACNIFWEVGSSATLNSGSVFSGVILASASVSFGTGATMNGRALASSGAVSLLSNTVTEPAP